MPRLYAAAALLLLAGALGGCSSTGDMIPTWAGGLPDKAPERPAVQPEFPYVNAFPQRREEAPLTDDEQNKLRSELNSLRDRQPGRASPAAAAPAPKKPEKKEAKAAKPAKKADGPLALQPEKEQGR